MAQKPLPTKQGFFCLGAVMGAHGIKGEVRVKAFAENPKALLKKGVPVDETGAPFAIAALRETPNFWIVRLENVTDRNTAETLRGKAFFLPLAALPKLNENEAYYAELEGATVVTEAGKALGTVKAVFDNGAHAVMDVYGIAGEALIPYTEDTVVSFKRESKTLTVTPFAEQFFGL